MTTRAAGLYRNTKYGVADTAIFILTAFVVCVVLAAGLLKSINIVSFARTLAQWTIFPQNAAVLFSLIIPTLEISLAIAWILNLKRRIIALAMMGLLLAFSLVVAWQFFAFGPVDRGCFGARLEREAQQSDLAWLLSRNLVFVAILFLYFIRTSAKNRVE